MPTFEEALEHLGIDYADATIASKVHRCLATADRYLRGAVGEDVWKLMPDDERAGELVLVYVEELYSERSTGAKASNAKRDMVHSMEWQLKLELARLREAAEGVS